MSSADTPHFATDLIKYQAQDGIITITLNNAPANCYSYDMMRDLDQAILMARMDQINSVIVLRGAGEKFFCAGADISMLQNVTTQFKYNFCLHANETLNRLEQSAKLTIAALNGHTVGGGLEVALACDIRLAAEDSGKIGLPEVNLGVLPGTGGTQRLARILNKSQAIELMVKGDVFDFAKAKDLGLVNHLFPKEDFMDHVYQYAAQFVAPHKAAKAVGLIKRAVVSGAEVSFEQGLALERELQQQLFESVDAKEGLAAYSEKRKAEFLGQ